MTTDPTGSAAAPAASKPASLKLWRFAPLLGFAALGVVFAYMLFNNSGGTLPSTLLERQGPDFEAPLLDRSATPSESGLADGVLSQADLRQGRVSVVNLWASWCAPCRIEHPQLMVLAAREDVDVYGVAFHDKPADSRAFLAELGDPFLKVGVDAEGETSLKWGVEGVPETFILDGEGRVILKHTGEISEEDLRLLVLPAIERAKAR